MPSIKPKSFTDSDVSLQHIHHWSYPGNFTDFPQRPNMEQRIDVACIASDRLLRGLGPYCNLHIVTPDNWLHIIEHIQPQMLLVESVITPSLDWHLAQIHDSQRQESLLQIVNAFKKSGIPSVFWNTKDILYHDAYSKFEANFDFIFYSDSRYENDKHQVADNRQILLPAFAPSLHNPLKSSYSDPGIDVPIFYDGWADLIRFPEELSFIRGLTASGLKVVDSRYKIFRTQLDNFAEMQDSIWGCVSFLDLLMIRKHSQACVTSEHSISSILEQQWSAVESAACRSVIFHQGILGEQDMRNRLAITCENGDMLTEQIIEILSSSIEANAAAQQAWRHAHQHHTFMHRLQQINDVIGLESTLQKETPVSVITATYRMDLVEKCVQQFETQSYSNKEFILVLNGDRIDAERLDRYTEGRPEIKTFIVPAERVEAGSLNHAISMASGEYIVKMDDDDFYGRHYVEDLMLHARSADLDLLGKANRYFYFEKCDEMYERVNKKDLAIVPSSHLLKAHIGGATLSGKRQFFLQNPYPEGNFSATDTHYYGNLQGVVNGRFAVVDDTGFIYNRRDAADHSWKIDSDELRNSMQFLETGINTRIME